MSFSYSPQFLNGGFTYQRYRQHLNEAVGGTSADEVASKMLPYITKNIALMDIYDETYEITEDLNNVLTASAPANWVVITEGWCGDAAFNVPMLAAIERAFPEKVKLSLFLRDSNLDLIDANLTDGGRSIPKLVLLDYEMKELGSWGPRPSNLQAMMKLWKDEGLVLKDITPKAKQWYDADATRSLQQELIALIKNYSV